jgi:hypothetical protein
VKWTRPWPPPRLRTWPAGAAADGGAAPGATLGKGVVVKITRERGGFHAQAITFVAMYSCTSVRDPELEPLLGKAIGTGALLKLKSVRREPHAPVDTCLLHGDVCLSSAEPIAIQEA